MKPILRAIGWTPLAHLSLLAVLLLPGTAGAGHMGGGGGDVCAVGPMRVIVSAAPGGMTDILARNLSERLGQALHVQVVVENKAGGGGLVARKEMGALPPKHCTFLVTTRSSVILAPLLMPRDPASAVQLVPLAQIAEAPLVLVTRAENKGLQLADLRASGGPKSLGYSFNGTLAHLLAASTKSASDRQMDLIPFKGAAQVVTAVMSGSVDLAWLDVASAADHVKGGKLRALAVTGVSRHQAMADVPTASAWGIAGADNLAEGYVVYAAPDASASVQALMSRALLHSANESAFLATMSDRGLRPATLDHRALAARERQLADQMGALVRTHRLQVD